MFSDHLFFASASFLWRHKEEGALIPDSRSSVLWHPLHTCTYVCCVRRRQMIRRGSSSSNMPRISTQITGMTYQPSWQLVSISLFNSWNNVVTINNLHCWFVEIEGFRRINNCYEHLQFYFCKLCLDYFFTQNICKITKQLNQTHLLIWICFLFLFLVEALHR